MNNDEIHPTTAESVRQSQQRTFDAYCALFEQLAPKRLDGLRALVSDSVRFCDPFNDVRGVEQMIGLFAHMFERCQGPRFSILDRQLCDGYAVLRWRFETGVPVLGWFSMEGMSRLAFDDRGRISEHLDFWDSAPFYLRLPLLGWLLRRLRGRMAAPGADVPDKRTASPPQS